VAKRNMLLEAAARLIPLNQGRLDNLCGLYSILNAIRLASWPVLERQHFRSRQLFDHGLSLLETEGLLLASLHGGMNEHTWLHLCDELIWKANRLGGIELTRARILANVGKTDTAAAIGLIDRHTQQGNPVLVELRGGYNHYTVVVEIRDNRLFLFDSFGYRWVSIGACELERKSPRKRHQIGRRSASVIRRQT
jgi:hypothetical protein